MRKNVLMILMVFAMSALRGQKTGTINYGQIESYGMGAPIGADYNAALFFNSEQSLFVVRQDSLEGGHIWDQRMYGDEKRKFSITYVTNPEGFLYRNDLKNNLLYSRDVGFDYVKEPTPKLSWTLSEDSKTIGKFTCQKATCHFRGRDYTAWYTTKIPLPYGPWKLQGLPGIILEAYDTHKEIYWYFKSLAYPSNDSRFLKSFSPKSDWITLEDYKRNRTKKYRQTIMNSRIVAERAEITTLDMEKKMLNSYIESFSLDE